MPCRAVCARDLQEHAELLAELDETLPLPWPMAASGESIGVDTQIIGVPSVRLTRGRSYLWTARTRRRPEKLGLSVYLDPRCVLYRLCPASIGFYAEEAAAIQPDGLSNGARNSTPTARCRSCMGSTGDSILEEQILSHLRGYRNSCTGSHWQRSCTSNCNWISTAN